MATDVRIVRGRDCVRTKADGTLDLATSRRLLAEAAATGEQLGAFDVLFDTRQAEPTLTVSDLWDLAYYLAGLPAMRGRKIAVLPPADDFDHADFFAQFSRARGLRVRSFASFEEALDWLEADRNVKTR
jgi:hypothetical protein